MGRFGCIAPLFLLATIACAAESGGIYVMPPDPAPSDDPEPAPSEALFRALEPRFVGECTPCHAEGGSADAPFLGDPKKKSPDPYDAVRAWPGIVTEDPDDSLLVTWPVPGNHMGPPPSAELADDLRAWLEAEASGVDHTIHPTLPLVDPIVPGFNAVALDPLGAELHGMAITFQAAAIGGALELRDLTVQPTDAAGLELEHPLFGVLAPGASLVDPDPIDSFSNVSQLVVAGEPAPLGPGALLLDGWPAGGRLSIGFWSIAVVDGAQQ
jgi:hypothetical protein